MIDWTKVYSEKCLRAFSYPKVKASGEGGAQLHKNRGQNYKNVLVIFSALNCEINFRSPFDQSPRYFGVRPFKISHQPAGLPKERLLNATNWDHFLPDYDENMKQLIFPHHEIPRDGILAWRFFHVLGNRPSLGAFSELSASLLNKPPALNHSTWISQGSLINFQQWHDKQTNIESFSLFIHNLLLNVSPLRTRRNT